MKVQLLYYTSLLIIVFLGALPMVYEKNLKDELIIAVKNKPVTDSEIKHQIALLCRAGVMFNINLSNMDKEMLKTYTSHRRVKQMSVQINKNIQEARYKMALRKNTGLGWAYQAMQMPFNCVGY